MVIKVTPYFISEIAGEGDDGNVGYLFEPIPLTEEWLLKFGAKKKAKNFYIKNYKNNWHRLSFQIEIYPNQYQFNNCRIYEDRGSDPITIKPLQYVHQLQNLYFALTGEELQIKKEVPA